MKRAIHKMPTMFGIVVLIWTYISGALCDVIDVDAAQYACISMEMLQNDTYLTITERGKDYLDKPPFLFWINCISFDLLGFINLAYKLPSLLFSLLGTWYIYKLGEYLYNRQTGSIAAIIFITSIGVFWINNDVKTDAILTACFVYALYQLILFTDLNRIKHLVFGSIGIGIGMLTKGPMAFIFPLAIIFTHLAIRKKLARLFRVSWFLLPLIAGMIILPMSIGLYQQFDLHPEKIVNGDTGVSGLRFYFWEQSFGRITEENQWKNNTSFFFLFGTFLYLIFPYSVLLIVAYYNKLLHSISGGYKGEYYLLAGSILVLSLLSLSSYKIPHYAIIVIPLASIIIAHELNRITSINPPKWFIIHNTVIAGVVFFLAVISFFLFYNSWYPILVIILLFACFLYFHRNNQHLKSLYITAITLGFVFNTVLIPGFQKYSEGRRFAELIIKNDLQEETLYFFNRQSRALEFYLKKRIQVVSWEELLKLQNQKENAWYYMSLDGKEALIHSGQKVEEELCLMHYDLNRIKIGFLNPTTRQSFLEHRFLIRFQTE
jgi:4-amino-4-deoxy-L-arabinose transferase-like glycosyltransferase